MTLFLSGAFVMGALIVALFFLRFWTRTREQIFIVFACAFLILAIERIVLNVMSTENELRPLAYLLRATASLFLAVGIILKNINIKKPAARNPNPPSLDKSSEVLR